MLMLTLFVGFVIGALTIVAVEALGVLFLIRRLNQRVEKQETKAASSLSTGEVYGDNLDPSCPNKQGLVWVLEAEKVPKNWLTDKRLREQKRKKEIVDVTPIRKYAKLKDQSLILTESDGSHTEIWLKGCIIAAVSATNLSSRKWAKRYPIKVDSKMSVIYHGSKTLYIYLETSWEKESWCKALRLASCDDKEQLKWFSKLPLEFHSYLTSLNIGYTSFMKPSMSFNAEAIDRTIKIDGSSSKVRLFLKKLAKKASKSGVENKASWTSTSGRDDRMIHEKSRSFPDSGSATGLVKPAPTGKAPNCSAEENMVPSTLSSLTRSGSSDAESDDKIFSDEGTLCWNLLLSRMFFDAKSNAEIKSSMQARMQRTLSNMRRPSYMGEVTCTGIHPGNLPPHIHGMRVLPSDMNEVVALEIDIEYSGGAMLYIETRFEVRELDFQEGTDTNLESSSLEVTSDLLEGFQYFGEQLNLSEGKVDEIEQKDRDTKPDEMKRSKSTMQRLASVSKWKSVVNSIAKQVSQVPLSLAIRVASLRGTLRLHIKQPPSDQLWFGFTAMPDVDFNLESSVGDHKITSAHIALFLISRFKAAIRETMVLPNCESICIPWMLAEKDDWVPRKVAPFIWIKQEAVSDPTHVHKVPNSQLDESTLVHEASRVTENYPEEKLNKANKAKLVRQPTSESLDAYASSSRLMNDSVLNENPLQELGIPLLGKDEPEETSQWREEENPEYQLSSRSLSLTEDQNHMTEGDDGRPRRMGTKARMLSLRKKMGEKLEEKRRHIEERGRNIVERMRGPDNEV